MVDLALDPIADRGSINCAGVLSAGIVVEAYEEVFNSDSFVAESLPKHFFEEGIIQPGCGILLRYHFNC